MATCLSAQSYLYYLYTLFSLINETKQIRSLISTDNHFKDRFPITHTVNMEHKVSLAAEEWCLRELDTLMFAERSPPSWLQNK